MLYSKKAIRMLYKEDVDDELSHKEKGKFIFPSDHYLSRL